MISRKLVLISATIILAMLAGGLWATLQLPATARIAVHFDASGEPNGWMSPWPGLFVSPAIAVAALALIAGLAYVDPRRANLARSAAAFGTLWLAPLLVIAAAQAVIVATAVGVEVNVSRLIAAAMGGIFVLIGNVLGKLRSNHVAGIRTPWTLADERVWDKTHRFGGWVFVAGGFIILLAAFAVPAGQPITRVVMSVALGAAALTVLKSYLLWRDREPR